MWTLISPRTGREPLVVRVTVFESKDVTYLDFGTPCTNMFLILLAQHKPLAKTSYRQNIGRFGVGRVIVQWDRLFYSTVFLYTTHAY